MSYYGQPANREMQLCHLEQAERHVAEGERHIAEQEDRIERLARHGHSLIEAKKLLENYYFCQLLHIQHRDRIRRELAG